MRYAYFPSQRRLAVETDGRVTLYDTGAHDISGVSQQQGSGTSLRFSGAGGVIDLDSLKRIDDSEFTRAEPPVEARPFAPEPFTPPSFVPEPLDVEVTDTGPASPPAGDVLTTIERLSDLQRKGILTEAEFAAKKAELLARL